MLDAYVPEAKIVLDSAANGVCPSRWFTSITFLYSKGILTGYPDGTVGWNNPLTRAEALTLIEKAVFAYEEN
jgi:hypothetical protein